jgi:hypothetical protein
LALERIRIYFTIRSPHQQERNKYYRERFSLDEFRVLERIEYLYVPRTSTYLHSTYSILGVRLAFFLDTEPQNYARVRHVLRFQISYRHAPTFHAGKTNMHNS